MGGVELLQQSLQVPETLAARRVLEGLVLGKDVDEALPGVVPVAAERLPAAVAEQADHVPDLAVGTEVRHGRAAQGPAAARRP